MKCHQAFTSKGNCKEEWTECSTPLETRVGLLIPISCKLLKGNIIKAHAWLTLREVISLGTLPQSGAERPPLAQQRVQASLSGDNIKSQDAPHPTNYSLSLLFSEEIPTSSPPVRSLSIDIICIVRVYRQPRYSSLHPTSIVHIPLAMRRAKTR
ncbi:hypothetical protein VTO42DRAFT_5533 [Malbranchea cinnamomea]